MTPRLLSCVEQWPECEEGKYDPRCCRFPKSCSATVYSDDIDPSLLEHTQEIDEIDILAYLMHDRDKTIELATLFLILFWRFGYQIKIETGYDEESRPEYYIEIFCPKENRG